MNKRYSAMLALTGLTLALSASACVMETDPEAAAIPGEEPGADGVVGDVGDVGDVSESDGAMSATPDGDEEDADRLLRPSTCVTIQRGTAGEVQDATIYRDAPHHNAGEITSVSTGRSTMRKLALLDFDLSILPRDAQITQAHLGLAQSWNEVRNMIRVHRILAPWSEHEVTWQSFGEGYEWTTLVSFITGKGEKHYKINVTEAVIGWNQDRSARSAGFVLDTFGKPNSFLSSEHAEVADRPYLHVCYVGGETPVPQ